MNAAPFLSTTWFSPDERATATAIASLLNYLGSAAAFLVGPLVVPPPNGTAQLGAPSNTQHIKDRIEAVLYAGAPETQNVPALLCVGAWEPLPSSGWFAQDLVSAWGKIIVRRINFFNSLLYRLTWKEVFQLFVSAELGRNVFLEFPWASKLVFAYWIFIKNTFLWQVGFLLVFL